MQCSARRAAGVVVALRVINAYLQCMVHDSSPTLGEHFLHSKKLVKGAPHCSRMAPRRVNASMCSEKNRKAYLRVCFCHAVYRVHGAHLARCVCLSANPRACCCCAEIATGSYISPLVVKSETTNPPNMDSKLDTATSADSTSDPECKCHERFTNFFGPLPSGFTVTTPQPFAGIHKLAERSTH